MIESNSLWKAPAERLIIKSKMSVDSTAVKYGREKFRFLKGESDCESRLLTECVLRPVSERILLVLPIYQIQWDPA